MTDQMAAANIVPDKQRTRSPYVFAVIYRDENEAISVRECNSRQEATDFVNLTGADRIETVYKVSEVIKIKTVVKL